MIVSFAERLWLGVPMFFVISGYCISATVDAQRRRDQRRLSLYFVRRVRRIFPPYWMVLATTVVFVGVVDTVVPGYPLTIGSGEFLRPWWYSIGQWAGNVTLTEQWRTNVFGGQKAWFLGHAWTLAYEEQFYLIAGLLLWRIPRRFFAGATFVSLMVGAVALLGRARDWPIDGFFFDGMWLQFYLGIVVYYVVNYGRWLVQVGAIAATLTVATGILTTSQTLMATKSESQAFLVALLFASVLVAVHRFDDWIAAQGLLRPFHYAGLMCYSLYLLHLPVNKVLHVVLDAHGVTSSPWLTVPVCASVSIPLAWWFHLRVERRFMSPSSTSSARPTAGRVAVA